PMRGAKLGEGFADRVVEAAMAKAQHEQLAATHPLVRLAQQRGGDATTGATGNRFLWRCGAAAVALAASLLLAIYFGRSPQKLDDPQRPPELAQVDPAPRLEAIEVAPDATAERIADSGGAVSRAEADAPEGPSIATNDLGPSATPPIRSLPGAVAERAG